MSNYNPNVFTRGSIYRKIHYTSSAEWIRVDFPRKWFLFLAQCSEIKWVTFRYQSSNRQTVQKFSTTNHIRTSHMEFGLISYTLILTEVVHNNVQIHMETAVFLYRNITGGDDGSWTITASRTERHTVIPKVWLLFLCGSCGRFRDREHLTVCYTDSKAPWGKVSFLISGCIN